jgi:hypothetical protein
MILCSVVGGAEDGTLVFRVRHAAHASDMRLRLGGEGRGSLRGGSAAGSSMRRDLELSMGVPGCEFIL